MVWQRNRAMIGFQCSKCHKEVHWDEWDEKEDMCLFCEFPETSPIRPAEMSNITGVPKNQTELGHVLEVLSDIPSNPRTHLLEHNEKKLLKTIKKRKVYKG